MLLVPGRISSLMSPPTSSSAPYIRSTPFAPKFMICFHFCCIYGCCKWLKFPGALCNYFSSVKLWVCSVPGYHSSFNAHELNVMKRELFKLSGHMTNQAPALIPSHLAHIVSYLRSLSPVHVAAVAALLIGFVCL